MLPLQQVKVFAKVHSLNDSANATFNTWCLTLMTVFALQQAQPAMLPPLALPLEVCARPAPFWHPPLAAHCCLAINTTRPACVCALGPTWYAINKPLTGQH